MAAESARPAFYALRSGGWRDYITLLHLPYTAWHLSYVVIGAALSPEFAVSRLWPTLLAFGLAVGIGAHALDELRGRPLRTQIPARVLVGLAAVSIAGAVGIGVVGAVTVDPWLAVFVVATTCRRTVSPNAISLRFSRSWLKISPAPVQSSFTTSSIAGTFWRK